MILNNIRGFWSKKRHKLCRKSGGRGYHTQSANYRPKRKPILIRYGGSDFRTFSHDFLAFCGDALASWSHHSALHSFHAVPWVGGLCVSGEGWGFGSVTFRWHSLWGGVGMPDSKCGCGLVGCVLVSGLLPPPPSSHLLNNFSITLNRNSLIINNTIIFMSWKCHKMQKIATFFVDYLVIPKPRGMFVLLKDTNAFSDITTTYNCLAILCSAPL